MQFYDDNKTCIEIYFRIYFNLSYLLLISSHIVTVLSMYVTMMTVKISFFNLRPEDDKSHAIPQLF